jgi:arginine utilization protein RocB
MIMKTVIHVDQHVIKANAKNGTDDPPLTVKTYKDNRRAYTAQINFDAVAAMPAALRALIFEGLEERTDEPTSLALAAVMEWLEAMPVVAEVVNRPHDPLSCGARVWIQTEHPVAVVTERAKQGEVSDDV